MQLDTSSPYAVLPLALVASTGGGLIYEMMRRTNANINLAAGRIFEQATEAGMAQLRQRCQWEVVEADFTGAASLLWTDGFYQNWWYPMAENISSFANYTLPTIACLPDQEINGFPKKTSWIAAALLIGAYAVTFFCILFRFKRINPTPLIAAASTMTLGAVGLFSYAMVNFPKNFPKQFCREVNVMLGRASKVALVNFGEMLLSWTANNTRSATFQMEEGQLFVRYTPGQFPAFIEGLPINPFDCGSFYQSAALDKALMKQNRGPFAMGTIGMSLTAIAMATLCVMILLKRRYNATPTPEQVSLLKGSVNS